jgi:hypothetical protein
MQTKTNLRITVAFGLALATGVGWSAPPQKIEDVLPRVSANLLANLQAMNWNIACNHRQTMSYVNKGVPGPPVYVVESVVVGRGRTAQMQPGEFLWSRQLVSFTGNPPEYLRRSSSPGDPVPAPSPAVDNVFRRGWFDHKLSGRETLMGRPVFIVESTTNSQYPQPGGYVRSFGKAWIDAESFQVIRLEHHLVNGQTDPATTVEFGKVIAGSKEIWLSTRVTVDTKTPTEGRVIHLVSDWSSCREYNVSVEVKPVQ